MFSELTKIYNNSSHGTFEDTVRAIINAALVLNPTLINASFSTTYESSSKRDYDQDKSNFASFVAKNATTDTRTSVKRFYYAITTGNWYPEESERCYDKERAKIIMTWLTSYIIIHAYGNCYMFYINIVYENYIDLLYLSIFCLRGSRGNAVAVRKEGVPKSPWYLPD